VSVSNDDKAATRHAVAILNAAAYGKAGEVQRLVQNAPGEALYYLTALAGALVEALAHDTGRSIDEVLRAGAQEVEDVLEADQ
jgi:hypothetical protein